MKILRIYLIINIEPKTPVLRTDNIIDVYNYRGEKIVKTHALVRCLTDALHVSYQLYEELKDSVPRIILDPLEVEVFQSLVEYRDETIGRPRAIDMSDEWLKIIILCYPQCEDLEYFEALECFNHGLTLDEYKNLIELLEPLRSADPGEKK